MNQNTSIQLLEYGKADCKNICNLTLLEKYLERNKLSSALKVTPSGVKANSYVGVIKFKNTQIEILPKLIAPLQKDKNEIDIESDNVLYCQILKNLLFMLSYTKKLNINTSNSAKLSKAKNPFLEVLIREYANSLFDCLKRLTPKSYIREEDNLNFLRGKLKFNENIRYNCANKAKFYCEFDEFSENCVLNQLFYYVSNCLYSISQDSQNKTILKTIIDYFCDIKLVKFDTYKCEKIKLTRQQQMFEKPFKLAKMFVENSSVDLSKNKFENVTLVWDMNKLFEEFIYQVIRRKIKEVTFVKDQYGKYLLEQGEQKRRLTKADIIVEKDKEKIIIDTKYKKLINFDSVSSSDLYQVGMYCVIHDENKKPENTRAILLYPKYPESDYNGEDNMKYNGTKYSVSIESIDLMKDDLKEDLKKEDESKICNDLKFILGIKKGNENEKI